MKQKARDDTEKQAQEKQKQLVNNSLYLQLFLYKLPLGIGAGKTTASQRSSKKGKGRTGGGTSQRNPTSKPERGKLQEKESLLKLNDCCFTE